MGVFIRMEFIENLAYKFFIDKAAAGEPIEVYGSTDTTKDLLYVKDLNIGVLNALKIPTSKGFYNIGYEQNFRLIDIVKAIIESFQTTITFQLLYSVQIFLIMEVFL